MDNINVFIKKILKNSGKDWTIGRIIKITVLIVAALLALSIVLAMFKWTFGIDGNSDYRRMGLNQILSHPETIMDYAGEAVEMFAADSNTRYNEGSYSDGGMVMRGVSAPMIDTDMGYYEEVPASDNAEDFETREYTASYEERNISNVCDAFGDLKPLEYVVFENANVSDEYCNFRFKVELEKETEIITLIESLNPKDFDARTFTLERTITNNTNEVEILERKLAMLDGLLTTARAKYAALRTNGDAVALVEAVNNEINLIERITNQKLSVQSRIDRLTNSADIQTERIDYSQFNVSVHEHKFIDWGNIGDDWKYAFERFIAEISNAIQALTIGLVVFILSLVKMVIFLSISVLALVTVVKFLWSTGKKIWKK